LENNTKKSDGLTKNILIYGISFLASIAFMMVYWYHPVYYYVRENITVSNIVPYAIFILLFIVCQLVFQVLLKKTDIEKIINKFDAKITAVCAVLICAVYALLLLLCYIREVGSIFDAPSSDYLTYHRNEKLTLLFIAGMFTVSIFVVMNIKQTKDKVKHSALLYVFAGVMGLIFCYALYTPNVCSLYYNCYHADAYINSVYSAMRGVARSEMNTSVYGYYGILLAPIVMLLGGDTTALFIAVCALSFLAFMCISYVIINIVHNDLVKILGIASLPFVKCAMGDGIYLQLMPHRILFASYIAAYLLFIIRHKFDEKIIFRIVGFLICALAVIWNFETGLVILVAYTAYFVVMLLKKYCVKDKMLYIGGLKQAGALIVTIAAAWCFTGIVNLCMGGEFISFKTFIFPLMNSDYIIGDLLYDYQKDIVAWIFIAATAFLYVSDALRKTNLNPNGGTQTKNDAFMFVIAVLAFGQMTYYINRPAYGNLTIAYFMSVIMVCVACDWCLRTRVNCGCLFVKILCAGFSAILLMVLMSLCAGELYNGGNIEYVRNVDEYRNMNCIRTMEEEIASYCPKDTKALGYSIPMIYSDLGWDSGYYLIDFADLGVYPESYNYLSDELNNVISEPIIIDDLAIQSLEDNIDLSGFYSRYRLDKSFEAYGTRVNYFVPVE
jgi:hypothetical protein